MANWDSLKAGQQVAIKPGDGFAAPAVRGAVSSAHGNRVEVQFAPEFHGVLAGYRPSSPCVVVWDAAGVGAQAVARIAGNNGAGTLLLLPQAGEERREAVRVRSNILLVYEVLPPDRVERAAEEIRTAATDSGGDAIHAERLWHPPSDDLWEKVDDEFGRISHQIAELNSKLDYLIAVTEGRGPLQATRSHRPVEDLSGTGLAFAEAKALPVGAVLWISLELSRFPRVVIQCLGAVASCVAMPGPGGQEGSSFHIGVAFSTINEDDRERIIHHVFRVQRRQLRNRREQRE